MSHEPSASCCSPDSERPAIASGRVQVRQKLDTGGMVLLPGGEFLMGCREEDEPYPGDGESPQRRITLSPFLLDACAVSNAEFATFVAESGHITEAEEIGWSFVFAGLLPESAVETAAVADAPWWRQVFGANWRQPEGPGSDISDRSNLPVVHVSWNDANAFAAWNGKRLPTEAEWEYAARGGLEGEPYPWGANLTPGGEHRCNTWTGDFPGHNTLADGYFGTAPVDAFPANQFGLQNMVGNTWEWCADWFDRNIGFRGDATNPGGPVTGTHRVIRGGSYLCHESYCFRYRVSARSSNSQQGATGHTGFRCARSANTE